MSSRFKIRCLFFFYQSQLQYDWSFRIRRIILLLFLKKAAAYSIFDKLNALNLVFYLLDSLFPLRSNPAALLHHSSLLLFIFMHLLAQDSFIKVFKKNRHKKVQYDLLTDKDQRNEKDCRTDCADWSIVVVVDCWSTIVSQDDEDKGEAVKEVVEIEGWRFTIH